MSYFLSRGNGVYADGTIDPNSWNFDSVQNKDYYADVMKRNNYVGIIEYSYDSFIGRTYGPYFIGNVPIEVQERELAQNE